FLYDEGWNDLSPKNNGFSCAGLVQSPEIAESHEQERSTAQESQNPTRGSSPSPRNHAFPSVGTVHRPGIAFSHAREWSIARKMQNSTRRRGPPLGKCKISR